MCVFLIPIITASLCIYLSMSPLSTNPSAHDHMMQYAKPERAVVLCSGAYFFSSACSV